MRPFALLPAALALAVLATGSARAAPFAVDTTTRTLETSTLKIQFDGACPERILHLWYKPFSTTQQVNGEFPPWQFSGQMIKGLWAAQGYIWPQSMLSQSWQVVAQDASTLLLRIESQSQDAGDGSLQPPVRTEYTFYADSSCYQVRRTVRFSQIADSTSLQLYVLHIATPISSTLSYRNATGVLQTGGFCAYGCETTDWDERWAQVRGPSFASTIMYAPDQALPMSLMTEYDTYSSSNWAGPITPTQVFRYDQTWRQLVHFTTTPANWALEDAVYTWFSQLRAADVPAPPAREPRFAIAPNPAAGSLRVSFGLPAEEDVDLAVLDLAGRRVATLETGRLAPGEHAARWDGRDAGGARAGAGLYLVRLARGRAVTTRKLVWLR